MARLVYQIPDVHRQSLIHLFAMADESFDRLHQGLASAPLTVPGRPIVEHVKATVQDGQGTIEPLVQMLRSLALAWEKQESLPVADFALGVRDALQKGTDAGDIDWDRGQKRLVTLLQLDTVSLIGRAGAILGEHERYFSDARILTDLRPVFRRESITEPPAGAALTHVLRISYYEETLAASKDFYVALDPDGLRQLLATIERAQVKEATLRQTLVGTQLALIDQGDHHG